MMKAPVNIVGALRVPVSNGKLQVTRSLQRINLDMRVRQARAQDDYESHESQLHRHSNATIPGSTKTC